MYVWWGLGVRGGSGGAGVLGVRGEGSCDRGGGWGKLLTEVGGGGGAAHRGGGVLGVRECVQGGGPREL